jgi:copper(I)-binding protein
MPRLLNLTPVLVLLTACAGDPLLDRVASDTVTAGDLTIHTVFALPPFTDAPMPVYFTVENRALVADTLLVARSPATGTVIFHGGAMDAMDAIAIPARGELALRPGGLHLMLAPPLDLPYRRGDSVTVTLTFARGSTVTIGVLVVDYADVDAVTARR